MQNLHYFINTEFPEQISFYKSNFSKLKKTIRLKKYSQGVISFIMSKIIEKAEEENIQAEIIHDCISDNVCGVILPQKSFGILCDSSGAACLSFYDDYRRKITDLFMEAKKIHTKQEEIYIKNTDFKKLDTITQCIAQMLFPVDICINKEQATETHRFFGAPTVKGNKNYIQSLTAELNNRFFIKGRPGTGKSTFMKKLAAHARNAAFDIELYHCALDPKSVDMLVVRELGLCVFDSTSPHEYFPERLGDGIIDIYGMCVEPETERRHSVELEILNEKYRELIGRANTIIAELAVAEPISEFETVEAKRLVSEIFNSVF